MFLFPDNLFTNTETNMLSYLFCGLANRSQYSTHRVGCSQCDDTYHFGHVGCDVGHPGHKSRRLCKGTFFFLCPVHTPHYAWAVGFPLLSSCLFLLVLTFFFGFFDSRCNKRLECKYYRPQTLPSAPPCHLYGP